MKIVAISILNFLVEKPYITRKIDVGIALIWERDNQPRMLLFMRKPTIGVYNPYFDLGL